MIIYVDLVFFLNLIIDFLLLLSISIILKRNVKLYRIILGSLLGSISTLLVFFSINNLLLMIIKLIISISMVLVTFSYKDKNYFFNNLIYLYFMGILLGGFLYLLNIEAGYKSISLIAISPIILFIYAKKTKSLGVNYKFHYKVDLYYKDNLYKFNAFLDSGNKLYDQYKKRPIILIHEDKISFDYEKGLLVPYHTASGDGLLKCIKVDKIIIDGKKEIPNILVGLSNDSFNIEGVNMILHTDIL